MNTRLKTLLDARHVAYQQIGHARAFTAKETAIRSQIPGRRFAKGVVVFLDEKPALTVIPATHHLDLKALKEVSKASEATIAQEHDMVGLFEDSEAGAEPPVGPLYELPTFIDEALTAEPEIYFNAGTHEQIIRMNYVDYFDLVRPVVCHISCPDEDEL